MDLTTKVILIVLFVFFATLSLFFIIDPNLISVFPGAGFTEQEMYEQEMIGVDAIKLRRKYPALQKAWDQYKTVWKLVAYND